MKDMPPPLAAEMVQEFVACSHGDFDRVKALLAEEPRLVNAAWDWGGGDFESGLGAASHCGQRAIAEYLLERGATMTLFAAAMLGKLALVQAILEDNPAARQAPGPHGIPLMVHAQMGGEAAEGVKAWLEGVA